MNWLTGLAKFMGWSLVFGVIYAQSPLYTSNQYEYFLHGLARAGYGYLSHDWLANTVDALPLFSALVYWTVRLFRSEVFFYLYYVVLLGVYLFSMVGIMDRVFALKKDKTRRLIFITLFLAVHSAAFHFILSRGTGTETPFLLEGGVAGQRLLGQVFQPGVFGVFLVLSIYIFLKERPFLALLPMAAATYFHPVYLLSAGLLTLAYIGILYAQKRTIRQPIFLGLTALLLVLPALAYMTYIFWPTIPEMARKIANLQVNFRNPHHAIVAQWLDWTVGVQALIVLGALFILRKTRLFPILAVLTCGTVLLTLVQVITGNNTLALLYPWRTSVLVVPLSTITLIAYGVTKILDCWKLNPSKLARWGSFASLGVIVSLLAIGVLRFQIETARRQADAAQPMLAFVASHKSSGEVYLVPDDMEQFRLATGAPIYADFKSTPDRDSEIMEWYRRIRLVIAFYNTQGDVCSELHTFARNEAVTDVVLHSDSLVNACPGLELVYQDSHYSVYSLAATK